jgi:hypothetical protein
MRVEGSVWERSGISVVETMEVKSPKQDSRLIPAGWIRLSADGIAYGPVSNRSGTAHRYQEAHKLRVMAKLKADVCQRVQEDYEQDCTMPGYSELDLELLFNPYEDEDTMSVDDMPNGRHHEREYDGDSNSETSFDDY